MSELSAGQQDDTVDVPLKTKEMDPLEVTSTTIAHGKTIRESFSFEVDNGDAGFSVSSRESATHQRHPTQGVAVVGDALSTADPKVELRPLPRLQFLHESKYAVYRYTPIVSFAMITDSNVPPQVSLLSLVIPVARASLMKTRNPHAFGHQTCFQKNWMMPGSLCGKRTRTQSILTVRGTTQHPSLLLLRSCALIF
jgi:hypothetical protein